MGLQSTGQISLIDIATEFGDSAPHSLQEFYGVATGIPTSGAIGIKDFYGATSYTPPSVIQLAAGTGYGATVDLGAYTSNRMVVIAFSLYTNQQDGSPGSNLAGMNTDWGTGYFGYGDIGFVYGNPSNSGSTYTAFTHSGSDKRNPTYAIYLLNNIVNPSPVAAQAEEILLSIGQGFNSGPISHSASDGSVDYGWNSGMGASPTMCSTFAADFDATGSESLSVNWGGVASNSRVARQIRFK